MLNSKTLLLNKRKTLLLNKHNPNTIQIPNTAPTAFVTQFPVLVITN